MPYTYILFSEIADKFYVGSTSLEVEDRLKKHLTNHAGFTGKFKDWKIVWKKHSNTIQEAKKLESNIKSWKSKTRIQKLILDNNL